ncbi:hypothetical protein ASZ90_017210 [hydrocarbon metagenome]|uniref:DUF2812 domain-containing protein n=1 Tax=hydrocarbon metagenome TaxID=938273 RepID=A0A0W8EA10_9ZZZZ
MIRFKVFIDFEKEEKWLNEMGLQGYELVSCKNAFYRFRAIQPGNDIIKIDYRTFRKREDFVDYCTIFQDSGWKHVAGSFYSGTQYFKKTGDRATDDIFSDTISKAGRYNRLSNMWLYLAIAYLPILTMLILQNNIDIRAILNPKLLYYTPGLWEKTGIEFWNYFLYETPFALLRGFLWLLLPILIVLYLFFSVKIYRWGQIIKKKSDFD